jgi:hypothetical protein
MTAVTDPNAAGRGVTVARIATLTAAIAAFGKVMNTPRGQIRPAPYCWILKPIPMAGHSLVLTLQFDLLFS